MAKTTTSTATIAGLNHDLKGRRSFVLLTWDDNAEKRLSLPVPFGCSMDDLPEAAEKALRELAHEAASLRLHSP